MASSQLYELTAAEMAAAVAKRELTPTEIIESSLERIIALEPRIHAWSFLDIDNIRAQAADLTAEAAAGKLRGPLHGVPVGIKDEFHVKGMPTGMRLKSTGPEAQDATPVARLRAAGALIMGKTHMPLLDAMPPTRNPWNLEYTPGGSSSGSGAAVGARMVPVTLAEQTAGSNLRPAGYCGVAGFKPTYGRISRYGCYPFAWSFDHPGVIGLTMEDIALVFSVIAGADSLDPTTLMDQGPDADLKMDEVKPPCIGIVSNFFPERSEPVMQEAIQKAGVKLKKAGANVVSVSLPDEFALTWHVHRLASWAESAAFRASLDGQASPRIAPEINPDQGEGRSRLRDTVSLMVPACYYIHAQRIRRWLYERVQKVFNNLDALLMGVAPGPAPKGLHSNGDSVLLVPWSCLGYPAITLNAGLSPTGLPLGLQLVGAPKKDFELLQLGSWCERVLGRLPAPSIS